MKLLRLVLLVLAGILLWQFLSAGFSERDEQRWKDFFIRNVGSDDTGVVLRLESGREKSENVVEWRDGLF